MLSQRCSPGLYSSQMRRILKSQGKGELTPIIILLRKKLNGIFAQVTWQSPSDVSPQASSDFCVILYLRHKKYGMTCPLRCDGLQVTIKPNSGRAHPISRSRIRVWITLRHSSAVHFALNSFKILNNRDLAVIAFLWIKIFFPRTAVLYWRPRDSDSHRCCEYRRRPWPDRRLIVTWPWACHSVAIFLVLFNRMINRHNWGSTTFLLLQPSKLTALHNMKRCSQSHNNQTVSRRGLRSSGMLCSVDWHRVFSRNSGN
jgi:hypothetical protein